MRRKKNFMIVSSFCLGALMFVTTAFADVVSKTGYEQFKDAIKYTAESADERLNSYTFEGAFKVLDNEKVLISSNTTQKYNLKNNKYEDTTKTEYINGESTNNYVYEDEKTRIFYSPHNDTYSVNKYVNGHKPHNRFENPFEQERAKDVERIFDALIGNLKAHVMVETKADGSKEFYGSLNDSQIPTVVNAITSYLFKQEFSPRRMQYKYKNTQVPCLVDNVYVKSVKGTASVNKNGIMNSLFVSGVLSGEDESGNEHNLTVEAVFKLKDLNYTVITKPDLTGKKVVKNTVEKTRVKEKNYITKKYIGKWTNNIVIEKDDSFIKVGERVLEITDIDDKYVYGKYHEKYKDKDSKYYTDKNNCEFKASIVSSRIAEIKDSKNSTNVGRIHFRTGSILFYLNRVYATPNTNTSYNQHFSRCFEE